MCATVVVLSHTFFAVKEKEDEDDEEDDNGDDDVYDIDMSILTLYPFLLEIFKFMLTDCNIKVSHKLKVMSGEIERLCV